MIFVHCAGNGDLYTTDSESGCLLSEFDTFEQLCAAYSGITDMAWFSDRDASDFYFYDFIWGDATTSVTVPVGRQQQMLTIHKPEHMLRRCIYTDHK